jgi:hypothetical protein
MGIGETQLSERINTSEKKNCNAESLPNTASKKSGRAKKQ